MFAKTHDLKTHHLRTHPLSLKNERAGKRIYEDTGANERQPSTSRCYEDHVNKTVHIALVQRRPEFALAALGASGSIKDTLRDVVGVLQRAASLDAARGPCARGNARYRGA